MLTKDSSVELPNESPPGQRTLEALLRERVVTRMHDTVTICHNQPQVLSAYEAIVPRDEEGHILSVYATSLMMLRRETIDRNQEYARMKAWTFLSKEEIPEGRALFVWLLLALSYPESLSHRGKMLFDNIKDIRIDMQALKYRYQRYGDMNPTSETQVDRCGIRITIQKLFSRIAKTHQDLKYEIWIRQMNAYLAEISWFVLMIHFSKACCDEDLRAYCASMIQAL